MPTKTETEQLNERFASVFAETLAAVMHRDSIACCPQCGKRLLVTVTLYAQMPVRVRTWGDGQQRVYYGKDFVETKKELQAMANANYADSGLEWREELHCESESCDYWCNAQDLETV